ncbi:MAG TPA: tryptophan synthase subunit alpha [Burkholderiales bacterium]|nr:tryptophan synthase subunit alpha [Burkholderiales bacterium]
MQRIKEAFTNKAKIAYLTAGDGGDISYNYFLALAKGGANILEIGVPFSDPIADGVVIQKAMKRSLANGTTLIKVLELCIKVRSQTEAAIILFTYYNQIHNNLPKFLNDAKNAGIDGILVIDLPYEESSQLIFLANKIGLAVIFVAAVSTSLARIKQLSNNIANGFLYYACQKGTTGVRDELSVEIENRIQEVKANSFLPVAVGFGVSNNDMVNRILTIADGCIIGSYFVNAIANNISANELQNLAANIFKENKNK